MQKKKKQKYAWIFVWKNNYHKNTLLENVPYLNQILTDTYKPSVHISTVAWQELTAFIFNNI